MSSFKLIITIFGRAPLRELTTLPQIS